MPFFFRISSFFIRVFLISSIEDIDLGNFGNFIIDRRSGWSFKRNFVALFLAEHREADWRLVRNFPGESVRLERPDHLVSFLSLATLFLHSDKRADIDKLSAGPGHYFRVLQNLLDLGDPRFELALVLPGLMVFRVLRKVAERFGIFQALDDFLALRTFEVNKFGFQLFSFLLGYVASVPSHFFILAFLG